MTKRDTPIGNDATPGEANRSIGRKAAESFGSDKGERHFLDLLEDDEVNEALRLSRRPGKRPTEIGTT
jgi:hypothetical protein